MLPIMNDYPRKKHKRKMIQGAAFLVVGLILALLMGRIQEPAPAEQMIAVFRFIGIMGGASVLLGGIWLVKGFFDWVQS